MTTPVLEVRNLVKHFGKTKAVNGVSFSMEPGICFGLLGPNGAGKTTTIEVTEGILRPTAGEILYKGKPRGRRFREEVGIQLQSTELLMFQTVGETLTAFRNLYNRKAPLSEIIATCQLQDILDQDNRRISGGQKQRLLLAMALVNDPELIFLDEPTTGLDPQARRHLWDIVRKVKSSGRAVVLTTHYMEEAEILCDKIAIVDQGKVIAMGTPEELLAEHGTGTMISISRDAITEDAMASLPFAVKTDAERMYIRTANVSDTVEKLAAAGADLTMLSVRAFNLEDLFLKLTGRKLRS